MENRSVDEDVEEGASNSKRMIKKSTHPVLKYRFIRHTIKIVFADKSASDERYGGSGDMSILEGELLKPNTLSDTVIIFMHPSGIQVSMIHP